MGFFASGTFQTRNRRKPRRANVVCHESREGSQSEVRPAKAFLCVPYVADERGKFQPAGMVTECPVDSGKRCRLRKHSWRRRKSGPCFPLRVLYCRRHGRYFTLYPIGHVPYSRQPLVPVDPSGHAISSAPNEVKSRWEGSWFRGGGRCFVRAALASRANGRTSFAGLLCSSTAVAHTSWMPARIVR